MAENEREVALDRRRDAYAADIQGFLKINVAEDTEKKTTPKLTNEESITRLANQHMARAEDNALYHGLRIGYTYFKPERLVSMLGPSQRRYFADMPEYPDGPVRRRSCILDEATGERWVEITYVFVDGKRVHLTRRQEH